MVTEKERNCFQLFDSQKDLKIAAFNQLSPEDYDTITKNVQHSQHPEQVEKAIKNVAINFCALTKEENKPFPYSCDELEKSLLTMKIVMQKKEVQKPTDLVSARMYVFSQLLTQEEQASVLKENFQKNPDKTREVMVRYASLLADEVVKLNIIENNNEARQNFMNEIITKKMNEMTEFYK